MFRVAAFGFALVGMTASAMAAAPSPGTYAAGIYIQNASGGGCLDRAGSVYAGIVQYGGLSSTKILLNVPIPQGPDMSGQTLSISSGAGTAHPSGNLVWAIYGLDQIKVTGTFTSQITEVDAARFLVQINETYSSCQETINASLVKTGPKL